MSLLKLLVHLSPLLVAHLFVSGNTIGYNALKSNKTVISSGPAEPPPSATVIIAPSLSPQVKKPPSRSPQGITPPSPSPQDTPPSLVPFIVGVLLIISFVVIFILKARWHGKSEQDQQDVEDHHIKHVPGMPVRFSYQELNVATDNFNERLGRGGFGSVFK
ncbi:hypothetical protein NC651_010007 [Populus alba x Populus x berolinensis]|nr:hypothetical protein NC651_010007 [Populus alba x Populus x berolinensis]